VVDGRSQVIEYSDLPAELASRRGPEGALELWAGSIAVHVLDRSFIERLSTEHCLPFHRAVKKVPYVGEDGQIKKPEGPNAVKLEQFIFDALPLADRWTVVETDRSGEFEPLKNAVGPDGPVIETFPIDMDRAIRALYGASWDDKCGLHLAARRLIHGSV
jgi:UDP-N-acetylglucosamine/UDP-N-acetylgalactosamine diphosphorylase